MQGALAQRRHEGRPFSNKKPVSAPGTSWLNTYCKVPSTNATCLNFKRTVSNSRWWCINNWHWTTIASCTFIDQTTSTCWNKHFLWIKHETPTKRHQVRYAVQSLCVHRREFVCLLDIVLYALLHYYKYTLLRCVVTCKKTIYSKWHRFSSRTTHW